MQTDEPFEPAADRLDHLGPPARLGSGFARFDVAAHARAILLAVTSSVVYRGVPGDSLGQVVIALDAQLSSVDNFYDDEQEGESEVEPAAFEVAADAGGEAASSEALADDVPPVDIASALPGKDVPMKSGLGSTAVGADSRQMTAGKGGSTLPKGGRATTTVFKTKGEGFKFLYVFDHSGSMGGSGHSALAAAKAELKASLVDLGDTHQFQIIFYNDKTTVFPLAGRAGRLVFGNSPNKARAYKFIDGIIADGGTRHEEPLLEALKYGPDVIFFLTDADQPELSPSQLARIRRANSSGAAINTIEFGLGPRIGNDNFLVRLAKENEGQYVYYDVTQLKQHLSHARVEEPGKRN